jgi:hypothetical protein
MAITPDDELTRLGDSSGRGDAPVELAISGDAWHPGAASVRARIDRRRPVPLWRCSAAAASAKSIQVIEIRLD